MSQQNFQVKMNDLFADYQKEHGHEPSSAADVSAWAVNTGRYDVPFEDKVKRCQKQLADALRNDKTVDPQGRVTRTKACTRVTVTGSDGTDEIRWLWADIAKDNPPKAFVLTAFLQRRESIRGDVNALKTDVDSYNDNHNRGKPIQLTFNFDGDDEDEAVVA